MIQADWLTAARLLLEDGVGILPTDTIYGFSTRVLNVPGIDRIYAAKERTPGNPLVVLAASLDQILEHFPVVVTDMHREVLSESHDRPTSVIYYMHDEGKADWSHPHYHRDNFAIRIPTQKPELIELLEVTGPIVSTSVNREGKPPYTSLDDIYKNFGTKVDFIVDSGVLAGQASQIIEITPDGQKKILR